MAVKNRKRRHLNESQRAMVSAKIATLKLGDNQHSEGLPIGRASDLLNVSERSIARARTVLDKGDPALQEAVEQGHLAVSGAAQAGQEQRPGLMRPTDQHIDDDRHRQDKHRRMVVDHASASSPP